MDPQPIFDYFIVGGEQMKNGKRLTKKQKLFLEEKGLDHKDYLSVKDTSTEAHFVHRRTGKLVQYDK